MMHDANSMVAQVESLPQLIRDELGELDLRVRRLLDHEGWLSVKRVVIAGCGDSHMAGEAAALAFAELSGVPTEPLRAMQVRYVAPTWSRDIPRNPLFLGISVSGEVARTREAVGLARRQGALTVAVTATSTSSLAREAERVLDCAIPDFAPAPGVRSYRISLLALYLIAIRLGEMRGRHTQDQANALREELGRTADALESTLERVSGPARRLAGELAGERHFVFLGHGPNFATALFSAAKLIEAAGRHAVGQDTEEWAHLQYFTSVERSTPTFLISPGGRGHDRAAELLEPMRRVGRTVVAVVPEDDVVIAPGADHVLPVAGGVREAFSPIVYAAPGELLAAHLAEAVGEPFFRGFRGPYSQESGGNGIRTSRIVEAVEA